MEKTKEIVVDFRRVHSPLTINGATVERVSSTKFLGVHITEDLSWTNNTAALAKKAQQRLYFLRKLRRARAPAPIMCTFYSGTIESILTSCITVWYGSCNASCRKSLQRIVRAAEKIVGVSLPSLQDIYSTRLTRKALCISGDPTHPSHSFFSLLPSGRRLRSLQARTSRLKDSFIHQAVRKLNSLPTLPPFPHAPLNSDPLTYYYYLIIIIFLFFLHVLICIFVIVAFCVCMYIYIYSCMYICMSIYIQYIYIYIYIYLICIHLYFYILLLVFSVICMHQGSESNAISILCMHVRYMWQN